jgi:hypothetical protein
MKKIMTIKIDRSAEDCLKETKEQRLERIKYASAMRTQVVPNKKHYDRKKLSKDFY